MVPNQMIIRSVKGTNNLTQLLFNTSLFSMKSPLSELESVEIKNGLRILNLPSSIIYGSPSIFVSNPIDVRTALSMINDASEILSLLLDKGHSLKAGRIVGAFRNIGNSKIAEMERTISRERQIEGIMLAKLKGNVYTGRKKNSKEDTLKFLSKPKNAKAIDYIKKGYKNIEVAKIVGVHFNTVTKIKKVANL